MAGVLATVGFVSTLEARQSHPRPPVAGAAPAISSTIIASRATTRTRRKPISRSTRWRRRMSRAIPRSGRKSCASFARGRCRRSASARPDEADLRRGDRVAGDVARSRGRGASESRPDGDASGGSRAPSTRTPSAICSRSTIDVASLLPADESSYGFDNVTVGDLSPTLLDRYVSAAEKISRVAVGRPSRSPGGETIRIPPDLTQEEHLDGPADRHARRRGRPLHVSAWTASTRSRSA